MPFVVYLKAVHGDWKSLFKDDQIKLFFTILFFVILISTLWLKLKFNLHIFSSFRLAFFNITSILTGTGYTSTNYNIWGGFGTLIILIINHLSSNCMTV